MTEMTDEFGQDFEKWFRKIPGYNNIDETVKATYREVFGLASGVGWDSGVSDGYASGERWRETGYIEGYGDAMHGLPMKYNPDFE